MSRIKWPVRRDNLPPYYVIDAGDHVVCECDTAELADTIVSALNANPDAGDVEEIAQRVHVNLVAPYAVRESALRSERDALAAQVTTMRGALKRAVTLAEATTENDWYEDLQESRREIATLARTAIALPADTTEERVQAALDAAREIVRLYLLGELTDLDIVPLEAKILALDGEGDSSR